MFALIKLVDIHTAKRRDPALNFRAVEWSPSSLGWGLHHLDRTALFVSLNDRKSSAMLFISWAVFYPDWHPDPSHLLASNLTSCKLNMFQVDFVWHSGVPKPKSPIHQPTTHYPPLLTNHLDTWTTVVHSARCIVALGTWRRWCCCSFSFFACFSWLFM